MCVQYKSLNERMASSSQNLLAIAALSNMHNYKCNEYLILVYKRISFRKILQ